MIATRSFQISLSYATCDRFSILTYSKLSAMLSRNPCTVRCDGTAVMRETSRASIRTLASTSTGSSVPSSVSSEAAQKINDVIVSEQDNDTETGQDTQEVSNERDTSSAFSPVSSSGPSSSSSFGSSSYSVGPATGSSAAGGVRIEEFDRVSKNRSYVLSRAELYAIFRLQARDMRSIDGSVRLHIPVILSRPNCIIMNMQNIRAIITHKRVLLLEPSTAVAHSFAHILREKLAADFAPLDPEPSAHELWPFELRAMEAILFHTTLSIMNQYDALFPTVEKALQELTDNVKSETLHQLLPVKKGLSAFRNRVLEVNNALSEILTNDDDMSEMYLTTKATIGHRRRRNQHDEVEMLFENYFKQVQDILYQVQDLQSSVRAVEEMINMRLDASRNRIIRLNLILSMASFSMGVGTVIAGVFGMNLTSGWENLPGKCSSMRSPGFESVVPGEERGGRPVRRGSMHEYQGPLHGILRDRSDLSRSPSRPQSRGSNPSTLDHVDPEMADRVNQIYRMLPRILDPISRSHIQSQLEAILDMQQQFPDPEDSFFEKLDVIYRNALDLVKTSPVEKNDIPSVSPANALESSIAASNTGWRMLRAVVIWHVFFVAAQSIFPDLSKHISTSDSPFIKSIADIFSGGWYIVYGGSSYLLALLPCLLAISLHSFRFSIFALICVCIGAAAHVVVPILAVSLYPLDSMTTSNIAAFIVYFAEVIPYALEITSFAMIIHTWSIVEEGFLPARSIPEKASAQSSPSKHKPEVLDSNVHDPEKIEDVSQVPPNMLIENDRSASRTPLSMGSDGFEDSIEDEHERPRSRSSEPRTPDRRATMSRSQSPHPPIPQSEPTSRDGSLRSRLSGSSFDGRRTDESASYRRRKAYA